MNSQSTPVHIRLWHKDFWLMAIANFLLAMTVYMLVPTMPRWLMDAQQFSAQDAGIAMAAFGVGLFALGAFISYMVQHYRRNLVCIFAVLVEALLITALYYIDGLHMRVANPMVVFVQRFAQGAVFGLAQMVLTSTLIIDTSESFQRTEANHSAAWFSRFALSMGPMAGLLIGRIAGFHYVLLATMACAMAVVVLVLLVNFPFRAPQDDIPTVSLDRFFLPHGFPLFVNLQLVTLAVGIILSVVMIEQFYSMMMVGFAVAILSQRFVFKNAELKSEVVTGLILMGVALLMMITRHLPIVMYAAPLFIGMGVGLIGSRFLLFFIKLSRHCQRGTSQSTFLLGWESGIAWGVGAGVAIFQGNITAALIAALVLVIAALAMYHFTHNWFTNNKNR
ncbi:Major Facilitator Superfamily protein [Prevotella sp. khp1]|uniref:MFS transporter n=2 Tax=Xylanibacter ruminicola TaxID=839 RepID=D5ETJ2_XYLR2|nr:MULTISPECIES: MFS transporter [Prevotellaceae]ADE83036.1 MFS transporter [Xylanibacter ruminicola 23]QVJ80492.1 MFS transporter [Xylanibacter ruminicola]SDQ20512.1 Major Facilitator Superfamily protein [Prevotella sp. khp1]SEH63737.1 Major Facilitator Superfamily protein [Xylanibacter ruminicola]